MAIALLQTKTITNAAISPGTVALSTTTTGSTIMVGIVFNNTTATPITSITLTGASFSKILSTANAFINLNMWYAFNITGATTPTISIAFDDTSGNMSAIVREYSGLATTDPLDKSKSASGTSVDASSGASLATTQADELIIGTIVDDWGAGQTYTVGSGFANLTSIVNGTTDNVSMEDKTISATGTQTATLTLGNSIAWTAGVATFKASVTVAGSVGDSGGMRHLIVGDGLSRSEIAN